MYPYMDEVFCNFQRLFSTLLQGRWNGIELFLLPECLVLIIIGAGGGSEMRQRMHCDWRVT